MRNLKFRAWDKGFKKFTKGYWIDSEWVFYEEVDWGHNYTRWENLELMQYTWLKDKNWKEIYEGDILSDKWIIAWVVTFWDYKMIDFTKHDRQHNHLGWYIKQWTSKVSLSYAFYNLTEGYSITNEKNYIEIIWNIYENPDLIK